MNASLIIFGAVGLLAAALVWVAYTANAAARRRDQKLIELRKKADESWARTLAYLQTERAERPIDQRRRRMASRGGW